MPQRQHTQTALLAAVLGVGLLGGTTLFAEQPRTIGSSDTTASDGTRMRNSDLTGGFYEDPYKTDNWYYDFYDSPDASRTNNRNATPTSYGDDTGSSDAAHPWNMNRSQTRTEQMSAFQQYYDEPWFYDQRDPNYGMPDARTSRMTSSSTAHNDHVVRGTVTSTKQVRNRTTGDQNTVALIKTTDGRPVITDLGPNRRTLDMALAKGDQIQVGGQWEEVGQYSVLMAEQVKSGVNRANLHRMAGTSSADNRQIEGRIQQFRDVRTNRGSEMHRTAAVQTSDGRFAIVDLGQDMTAPGVSKAAPGDRIVADGRVVQVGNYPVLLANQVAINDGQPVQIPRRADTAGSTTGSGINNPDCLGGGCENQSINRGQPRDPHTNAMDGTIREDNRR